MADNSPPEAYLVLTTETGQRETHRVVRSTVVLGRGAETDLLITNPRVSRRHAELTWDGEQFVVQDLDSTNGTRINGAPITTPTPIRDGDSLELADTHLQFQVSAPTVTFTIAPTAGALSVDLSRHEVRMRGELVSLTPKEYRLIALLYRLGGAVATREDIASEVWPEFEGVVSEDSIAQVIARLRRKMGDHPHNPQHILTVRGFGYRLATGGESKD